MSTKDQEIKIVTAAETSTSMLDNPDVLDVLENTTNETRPETDNEAAKVGRIDAAKTKASTEKKHGRGRPKGTTKPKNPALKDIKCNFAVVLPPEKAKEFSALVEKLDSEGVGKVNSNIALNMAVDLFLKKFG